MAMSSRYEDASATAKLPHDVKASIVSFLNGQQAKQVALVSRQWKAATEDHLWSRLHVPSRIESGGYDMRGNREIVHIQSFVKDKEERPSRDADGEEDEDRYDDRNDDTLVRCWMAPDSSLFRLQPHEFARELPLLQIAAEISSSPEGSNRYSFHFCPRYMPDNFEIPARFRLPGCTPDPKWIELTYYRNRPLPFVLLDHMFSHIEHERFPAKGQRGLTLPQHAWDMLDGWYSEVEFRVERFGVPRRKEPRAENPDDDYWL